MGLLACQAINQVYCRKADLGGGHSMGVIFDEPKYPVIDKAPGFLKTGE